MEENKSMHKNEGKRRTQSERDRSITQEMSELDPSDEKDYCIVKKNAKIIYRHTQTNLQSLDNNEVDSSDSILVDSIKCLTRENILLKNMLRKNRRLARAREKCNKKETDKDVELIGFETQTSFDKAGKCRICMEQGTKMKSIFEDQKNNNIVDKVKFCTGLLLKKEKGLPTHICLNCYNDLSIANKFKISCLESEKILHENIPTSVKVERFSDDFPFGDSDDNFRDSDDNFCDSDKNGKSKRIVNNKDCQIGVKGKNNDNLVKTHMKDVFAKVLNLDDMDFNVVKTEDDDITDSHLIQPTRRPKQVRQKEQTVTKKKRSTILYCHKCDLKFESKVASSDHKKKVHKENESWVCEICGKQFAHRASHYQHIRSHLPPQYACTSCDYKTWHKSDLVKHTRIHADIKLYQCELCAASFRTSSNLTGHIRRYHEGIKPFACHLCERTFFDRTKLNRHVDAHNDIKRYECNICHSMFTRRCYWKKHMDRQHGVTVPFQRPGRQKLNMVIDVPGQNLDYTGMAKC